MHPWEETRLLERCLHCSAQDANKDSIPHPSSLRGFCIIPSSKSFQKKCQHEVSVQSVPAIQLIDKYFNVLKDLYNENKCDIYHKCINNYRWQRSRVQNRDEICYGHLT
jgi:glutamate mutase epsilon subunit